MKDVVSSDVKWTLIRDNDCLPPSKQERAGNANIKDLDVLNKEIKFQKDMVLNLLFLQNLRNLQGYCFIITKLTQVS